MRAVKGNREYTIDESQQKFYQDGGFDILGDNGETIAYGRGKTVPYDEHVKEIERLRELAAERNTEIETLKAEIAELKAGKQETKAPGKKAGE